MISSKITRNVLLICFSPCLFGQASQTTARIAPANPPLTFEENRGQFDAQAKYLLRQGAYNLFVTNQGAVIALEKGDKRAAVRLEFIGADPQATARGEALTGGRSNYFIGPDRSKWVAGAAQFEKVRIPKIKPGVDLVLYGNLKQFEYDLVVSPGVDPGNLRFQFKGADRVSLTSQGELKIETPAGNLIEHKPLIWQKVNGEKRAITGAYEIARSGEISVKVGPYDRNETLVIDPVISYSTFLGGSGGDRGTGIAVDASGNTYVAGQTGSADFPAAIGAYRTANNGNSVNLFVSKLNASGTNLIYSTYIGGSSGSFAPSLAIDSAGNAYVTGYTDSRDFPTTTGAYSRFPSGTTNAFVTKINASGNQLIYSTFLGEGQGRRIVLDASNPPNAYVVGNTASSNYPVTPGAYAAVTPGTFSGFVTKLNGTGTALAYSAVLSGAIYSIALDRSNNAYLAGFAGANFPVTSGAYQTTYKSAKGSNAFVSLLSADGAALLASSFLGGTASDGAYALALDSASNVYLTGTTDSPDFPTTAGSFAASLPNCCANLHGFVSKFNPSLSTLIYSSYLGGSGMDSAAAIVVDSSGNAVIAGSTTSVDFPVTPGSFANTVGAATFAPAFLTQLNAAGSALVYSTFLGGTRSDSVMALALDSAHGAYLTGSAYSSDFPTSSDAYQAFSTKAGGSLDNAFVTKVDLSSPVDCSFSLSPQKYDAPIAGGSSSFSISAAPGCPWNLVNPNSWITPTSPLHGIGPGVVNFTVPVNAASASKRTGSLSIGRSSFTIAQPSLAVPAVMCTFTASAVYGSGNSSPAAGGTGSISLNVVGSGCSWTAVPQVPWLQVLTGSGTGSAAIGFAISPNPGLSARSGQILVGGQTVTVNQAAGPSGLPASYTISTIAGISEVPGTAGDGGPATAAKFMYPSGVAYDAAGNLFIADRTANRVRKISTNGIITTVAGTGIAGDTGDGSAATSARLFNPATVAVDTLGNLYIGELGNTLGSVVRKVSSAGVISTVPLPSPKALSVAVDSANNLYVGEAADIRKVTPAGAVSLFAGGSQRGFSGDGGSAIGAGLDNVDGLAVTPSGDVFLSDSSNVRVRKITNGIINTVAGTGTLGSGGNGPATTIPIGSPQGLAVDTVGNLLITDFDNYSLRRLTSDGNLTTIAGNGTYDTPGNGGPATAGTLYFPLGVAADSFGNIAVASTTSLTIRLLSPVYTTCTFSVPTTTGAVGPAGGALPVTVTATAGCAWSALPAVNWITSTSGTGSGTATLTVSANTTGVPRTGTVNIAGTTFTVTQMAAQSITFAPIGNAVLGSTVTVSATATSSLPVTFTSSSLTVCTVSGNTVTLLSLGSCTIIASQPGDASYAAAAPVSQSFTVQGGLRFIAITPCRVADTRGPTGPFGSPAIPGQSTRNFVISQSACSIPITALAFAMNVAVVPQGPLGYLTVWPAGQQQPNVSTINSDGRIKSNGAIFPAGSGGAISVFASNTTDVVLDINGYFVAASDPTALAYYPITPCRISDTRNATGPLGGPFLTGQVSRTIPFLSSSCSLPGTARAYSINVAVVPRSGALGYLTVWPSGQPQPLVSTLNALTGATTSNGAIVPAGTGGAVDFFASNDTELVIDVNGYFAPSVSGSGLSLFNLQPCRVLDSRLPSGASPFSGTTNINVTGSGCGMLSSAQAFVLNATAVPPGPLGYLTLWPQGTAQPLVSTLNAVDGAVTGNLAIVPTSNGSISAFATNNTYLVIDVFGYFAPLLN